MVVRVAINGFGRIGRQVLQAGLKNPNIEWIAVNDLSDPKQLAYLLKYDSVYGIRPTEVGYEDNALIVNGKRILLFRERDPAKLPWKDLGIDVVVESTGFFTERAKAQLHIDAGAKKVLISAPAKGDDITIVKGVNEHVYDVAKHHVISNASCTTNCLAPLVKVLHDNVGVEQGSMITVHAYTADQALVDSVHKKDPRRGRAAAQSIVPTSTGAAVAVTRVIPDLKGRLDGFALRVPVVCGSFVSFSCTVKTATDTQQINWLFSEVAKNHLKGIVAYNEDPIVSKDILGNAHSSIFEPDLTQVLGNLVTVNAWYDNEWGYANRMVDVISLLLP